jgi:hypothetical protein
VSDELVDVGYRDPWEEPDIVREPAPGPEEYADGDRPRIVELGSDQLERLLAFGTGMDQVLARRELERRAGAGYQPSLLGPAEQLATSTKPAPSGRRREP